MMIIRAVMVFAEGIFEGETLVKHPRPEKVSTHLDIPLVIPKDTPLDIHLKVLFIFSRLMYHIYLNRDSMQYISAVLNHSSFVMAFITTFFLSLSVNCALNHCHFLGICGS